MFSLGCNPNSLLVNIIYFAKKGGVEATGSETYNDNEILYREEEKF